MKTYIIKIISITLLLLLLIFIEGYAREINGDSNKTIRVVIPLVDLSKTEIIKEEMLAYVEIQETQFSKLLVTDKELLINKYPITKVLKNQLVYEYQFDSSMILELDDNERMLTIKFSIEESNGWNVVKGQIVDLILLNEIDNERIVLKDLRINSIFDENLNEILLPFNNETLPLFISFITTERQFDKFMSHKVHSTAFISIKKDTRE